MPHIRNQNCTGREEELKELRASLNAGETAALVQPRAISGLGGVGKTQLAVEYAYVTAQIMTLYGGYARKILRRW